MSDCIFCFPRFDAGPLGGFNDDALGGFNDDALGGFNDDALGGFVAVGLSPSFLMRAV